MSRLDDLRRQRSLLTEHLAWLDREIAAEEGPAKEPQPAPAADKAAAETPVADVPADTHTTALMERYTQEAAKSPEQVRRGCFILFAIALCAVILGTVALWWFRYR